MYFFQRKKKNLNLDFQDDYENDREKSLKHATASLVATGPCVGLTILVCSIYPPLTIAFIVVGSIVACGFLANAIRLYCKGYAADDAAMIAKSFQKR